MRARKERPFKSSGQRVCPDDAGVCGFRPAGEPLAGTLQVRPCPRGGVSRSTRPVGIPTQPPSYGTSPAAGIEVPAVAIHAESGPTRPVGRRSGWPRRRVVGWRKTAIDDADACVSTQVLNGRSSACPFDGLSTVPGWKWRLDGRSGSWWLGEPLSDANETSAVGRCRCGRCARAGQGNAAILLGPAGPTGRYRTTQVDVAAGHSPERHHLDELDEGQASYGSEGWGFESLRARSVLRQTTRPLTSGNAGGGLARSSPRSRSLELNSTWCCRDAAGSVL